MLIKKINIKNRVHNYYFDNLLRAKKLKKLLRFGDLFYQISSQEVNKNVRTNMYYHELMGKIEEHE